MLSLLLPIIYIAFISLGLPDSLLGSAWPLMYGQMNVPVSYAGIISMIIAFGTIISSLQSDRLTKKLGPGKVTAISVGMTAFALFGFSISSSFWMLCLWAIPYGLGAGSVDAALNNYVALHYKSRHMSWLHCMWGVGASIGPYIMGFAISNGANWTGGYKYISILQIILTIILFLSLPLWKKTGDIKTTGETQTTDSAQTDNSDSSINKKNHLPLKKVLSIPGAKEIMITFFCYCGLEATTGLWGSSYFVLYYGISADEASSLASLFFIGITVGRMISGFLTMKLNDNKMVRLGQGIILVAITLFLLPLGVNFAKLGFILIGLGCAPIYPCIIHSTPTRFGADKSQAVIGIQMASAYIGSCIMPPIFGFLASKINIGLFPYYLLTLLIFMFIMHELTIKKTTKVTLVES